MRHARDQFVEKWGSAFTGYPDSVVGKALASELDVLLTTAWKDGYQRGQAHYANSISIYDEEGPQNP